MQAQLTLRRSPSLILVALFAIAAALLLGGAAGYVLKPAVVSSAPARVVVVHDEASQYATMDSNDCIQTSNPHVRAC